jgi:hypothetical protein
MVPFGKINKRITKKLNWTWWQDVLFLGEVIQDPFHETGVYISQWIQRMLLKTPMWRRKNEKKKVIFICLLQFCIIYLYYL